MKSQLKLITKVVFYSLVLPFVVIYGSVYAIGEIFCKYESQTTGLLERIYPNQAHGYDLSHHNKNIKWDKLDNAQFVYLKATEGTCFTDPKFKEYTRKAKQYGIKVGAYHFMLPKTSGKQQFEHFKAVVGHRVDLVPVLDVERTGITDKNIKQFINECEKYYGMKPMIYANQATHAAHKSAFAGCKWWMAHYRPSTTTAYTVWQYSDKKKVNGMQIDHNYINPKYTIENIML